MTGLIKHFCTRDDLATYDPYDIWKTPLGLRVKDLYNGRPLLGLLPAAGLTLADNLLNSRFRWSYEQLDYPIARAFAVLCLLNLYRNTHDFTLLERSEKHLQWLLSHRCDGCEGFGWGLGFPHAVSNGLIYDSRTPFSTITPYVLEAFIAFEKAANTSVFDHVVESIFHFFDRDIQVIEEDSEVLATSYGPFRDRIVLNSLSYAMYSYALCLPKIKGDTDRISVKIKKLYEYIRRNQREDGSWLYSPQAGSFIDCFHSCIVVKNIWKASQLFPLKESSCVVQAGYDYVRRAFLDPQHFLFRRFSLKNKPGLIRFDLYDNAEVLNLSLLLGDTDLFVKLLPSVIRHFCRNLDIYSQIDLFGSLKNKNTLRWAAMPFLYAASQAVSA